MTRQGLRILTLALLAATAARAEETQGSAQQVYGIVIHGGAGTIARARMTPEQEKTYRETLAAALDRGYAVLEQGGAALDAVEAALVHLEDSPLFNAGRGAVLTHEGAVEMDASIMDGATGAAGAVAAVTRVRNPVRAARGVLAASPHVMLVGAGADAFAEEQGLPLASPAYFRTQRRQEQLERVRSRDEVELDHGGKGEEKSSPESDEKSAPKGDDKHGTVGAVALDRNGRLAAATSTGGMTNKRWGRVGDSPIIGAGTFADPRVAVSCTGHGEYFIREAAAHSVAARVAWGGASLAQAARAVIDEQIGAKGGTGGLIAIDRRGAVAMPYNTGGMFRGVRLSSGRRGVFIWKD